MRFIILLLVVGLALYLLALLFLKANPARVAQGVRWSGVVLLGAFALLFLLLGRIVLAGAAAAAALALLQRTRIGRPAGSASHHSTVRSGLFEMSLDHATGAMHGVVRAGPLEGSDLDDLDRSAVLELWSGLEPEGEDARLLAAYLDRRFPGWREDGQRDGGAGQGAAPDTGGMSTEEAYDILGLEPGAGEAEIHAAHRRLMKRVHPDRGGSSALAARINAAKDILLKHR